MKKELFANKEMAQQEGGWLKIGHIKTETMEFYRIVTKLPNN